ncbi:hypothetical protein [Anaerocolumna sp. MB42-C2]|uniref:hypothetical protein n=1 Tax=Anaerocolumna sp. MB42-C2 TaxID=3070997 RepID=UPI0027E18EB7|nr:hypothetical protein [Anaerocolumna sp. MB42-C2]WMJ89447.1 hypothetical protein RBU59_07960 [Anaerocolumna sp. MB42-C2]
MTKIDLHPIHAECLDYLLEYKINHKDFHFVPRMIDNKGRLSEGLYFRGNDEYLQITFWLGTDSLEKIYNIAMVINNKSEVYLEISCRDNEERAAYTDKLTQILEDAIGRKFKLMKEHKWQWHYAANLPFMQALNDYITVVKPIIDDFVSNNPQSGITNADAEVDKYLEKLPGYEAYLEKASQKAKKTGEVTVKASDYMMHLQHNEVSNALKDYLIQIGFTKVETDKDFVDIRAIDLQGRQIFFEIKTATTVKLAIRQALGQLLEYNHYPTKKRADKLIIVTKSEPNNEDIQYLTGLRQVYNIPVFYQQFDMGTKVLSQEY